MDRIALIGAGFIGQAWAIVFARAGHTATLYDPDPGVLDGARDQIAARLEDLRASGLIDDPDAVLRHVAITTSLDDALDGAGYVQESGPENVEVKRAIFADLDRRTHPDAILASSTSGIPASRFTEALQVGRAAWSPTRSTRRSWSRWSSCAPHRGPIPQRSTGHTS
jgi:L-gulonate 3-dehydrogenase